MATYANRRHFFHSCGSVQVFTLVSTWFIGAWFAGWLPLFILMLMGLYGTDNYVGLVAFLVFALILNTALAKETSWKTGAVILGMLLGMFLVLKTSGFDIAKRPFEIMHLGKVEAATLVVTKQACDAINWFESSKCFPYGGGGVVSNVKIISRIGSEFVLELPQKETTAPDSKNKEVTEINTPHLMLKKDQIQAWSYNQVSHQEKDEPKDKTKAPPPAPSAPK